MANRRWITTSAPAAGLFTVALFSSQVSGKAQVLLNEQPAREGARGCKAFWETTYPLSPPPTFATRGSSVGFPGGGPPPPTRKHCLVLGNAREYKGSCIDTVGAQSRSSEKNSNRFTAGFSGAAERQHLKRQNAECRWWFVGCDGPNLRYITISWGRCARGNRPRSSLLRMATKEGDAASGQVSHPCSVPTISQRSTYQHIVIMPMGNERSCGMRTVASALGRSASRRFDQVRAFGCAPIASCRRDGTAPRVALQPEQWGEGFSRNRGRGVARMRRS